jgi:hypothetical protein
MTDTRPFRFEDLNGKPEPESWGPKYSKPPKPGRKVDIDRWPSNCASGQKYDFDAAKHRAKLRAEFAAQANADRKAWAEGRLTIQRPGFCGNIYEAYQRAPKYKPRKPHYVLRAGEWRIAA